ncbi:hypothetical protein QM565_03500, partial [Geitlerinema splendidum]|nr:hypothetical protein [Geitlerinema splendidum]
MKTTRFLYWFRQVRFPALAAALVMLLSMGTGTAEATNLPTGFTETTILSSFSAGDLDGDGPGWTILH